MTSDAKEEMLTALYSAKLPFSKDGINRNREMISAEELAFQTRFNTLGEARFAELKPELEAMERQFGVKFSEKFRAKSYAELRDKIIADPKYVSANVGSNASQVDSPDFSKALASALLAVFSSHDAALHSQFMSFAFDPAKALHQQLTDLEASKTLLEQTLFKRCTDAERPQLLAALAKAAVPAKFVRETLVYLKSLGEALRKAGMKLVEFVSIVPKEMYHNPALLRVVTDFFFANKLKISLQELYSVVNPIAQIKGADSFMAKLLKHCKQTDDYSSLEILKAVNFKAKDVSKAIDWVLSLDVKEIGCLTATDSKVNLKQLFRLKTTDKMVVVKDIACKLGGALSAERYSQLVSFVARHDLEEGKLVRSYLLAPDKAMAVDERVALVFDALSTGNPSESSALQDIFSEKNLARFDYNPEIVRTKLASISYIGNGAITVEQQDRLFGDFEQVVQLSKGYRRLNYNQIHDESVKLKHGRRMSKEDELASSEATLSRTHALDLKFLALSSEAMYRATGLYPRYHQVLAALLLMSNSRNLIEEAATGEGKTIIAALESAYLWFTGQTVDMLTSSRTLADRDLYEFAPMFDMLGIEHSPHAITPSSNPADYKQGGINYAAADDMALFRANRQFFAAADDPQALALNADVSVVCDEGDNTLTSPINFKLAAPLLPLTPDEVRVLFKWIMEFVETDIFKNPAVSPEDQARNLEMFLRDKFAQRQLHFPLKLDVSAKLQKSAEPADHQIYLLNQALAKLGQEPYQIFAKLLESVQTAQAMVDGKDFVVKTTIDGDDQTFYKAVPIVKHHPSPGTVFGNGVQAFLHLKLEAEGLYAQWAFEQSLPTATIFNISPKNLFDYYTQTGGRIVILTATPGGVVELNEFGQVNLIQTPLSLPRFNENLMKVLPTRAMVLEAAIEVVSQFAHANSDRPILVFADSVQGAKNIYEELSADSHRTKLLCAGSEDDALQCKTIARSAGQSGHATVTTPMLGRGVDFKTNNSDGFMLFNLGTEITLSEAQQMIGRAARNGQPGTVQHLCDIDIVGNLTCGEYMDAVSRKQQAERLQSQPLSDVLSYVVQVNRGKPEAAIRSNALITEAWQKILKHQTEPITIENAKALRTELIEAIKQHFAAEVVDGLNAYLQRIDVLPALDQISTYDWLGASTGVYQPELRIMSDKTDVGDPQYLARHLQFQAVEFPASSSSAEYRTFYSTYLPLNYMVMTTHVFSLPETKFDLGEITTAGIQSTGASGAGEQFDGEGSGGSLMLDEFKISFSHYHHAANSREVDGLRISVDQFVSIRELDIDGLQLGKWQPLSISTLVTSEASHAESLLTDGRVLLWVNSEDGGIKIFLIKQEFDQVRSVLRDLKGDSKSQTETRKAIYALLGDGFEAESNKEPEHVVIPMPKQTIGNCGWAQIFGMLKALAVVQRFDLQGKLPAIDSREWQKALKDAEDIYQDWQQFDKATRLEAMTCLADRDECRLVFLDEDSQAELEKQRAAMDGQSIIGQQLLERTAKAAAELDLNPAYSHSIYEDSIHHSARSLALLSALGSERGQTLQKAADSNRTEAKALLQQCQEHVGFDYLAEVHKEISLGRFAEHAAPLFEAAVQLACVNGASEEQVSDYLVDVSSNCGAEAADTVGFMTCAGIQAAVVVES